MKILFVGINYSPELTGIGKYSGELIDWLVLKEHKVSVITAPPYYPDWKVKEGYKNSFTKLSSKSLTIHRCPLYVPSSPSGLKRILHHASFAITTFPLLVKHIFWKPDVVFFVEPSMGVMPGALLVSKLSKAKAWLHVQDFEVDAAFELGLLKQEFLRKMLLSIESMLMKSCSRVSSISPNMVVKLKEKGVASENAYLFPNWVDCNEIFPLVDPTELRQELGLESSDVIALYSGNMGEKQGLESIIAVAKEFDRRKYDHIRFIMCGNGSSYTRLLALAEGLSNITWLPLQPIEKLNTLLNTADIHLLPQSPGAADLVMPSKLTGMLASGRPVVTLAAAGTQLARTVSSCGKVVEPDDYAGFAEAIVELVDDPKLRDHLGKNAREYAVKVLGKESILKYFESELKQICN